MDKETLQKGIELDSKLKKLTSLRLHLNSNFPSTLTFMHRISCTEIEVPEQEPIRDILAKHEKIIRSEIDDLIIQTEHQLEEL